MISRTQRERDIRAMRRYVLLAQAAFVGVSLFGAASLTLFFEPSWLGIAGAQRDSYRGDVVWLLTGIGFLTFAVVGIAFTGKWTRRLIWVFEHVRPEPMTLRLEIDNTSEDTHYYALLSAADGSGGGVGPVWRVALYSPSWDVRELSGRGDLAQVYKEPGSEKPAVIETGSGLLWRMAGSGSAEKLS